MMTNRDPSIDSEYDAELQVRLHLREVFEPILDGYDQPGQTEDQVSQREIAIRQALDAAEGDGIPTVTINEVFYGLLEEAEAKSKGEDND
jgi:formiminotetrahydrofolate cyclodeaminase